MAGSRDSAARLPVSRVILYKKGVAYFEYSGRVRGSQDMNVEFTPAELTTSCSRSRFYFDQKNDQSGNREGLAPHRYPEA